ncbi:MAG: hypothetical protein IKK72_03455 [Oscillospiraceae bacterium]|nr:hypothetical protein [Oscillospiraceae bacterium]
MAYQGKFSQPRNTEENIRLKAEARKKAEAAQKAAAAQQVQTPAFQQGSAVRQIPVVQGVPVPNSVQPTPVKKSGKRKKKKGNRTVTIIFYTVYFALVAACLAGMFFLNGWLTDWLTDYEASQPTTKCAEIFQETFADPDWEALYDMAGIQDTAYEGSEAFAAFMEAKVGSQDLTYVETSAGLSGGHKYLLKLEGETIGYFTLEDHAPKGADVADWQLGTVNLNTSYDQSVTVQTMEGITVYINGVALTDDNTIRIGTTRVEDYLPEGVYGPRIYTQYLEGLMVAPQVTAADEAGNPVEISHNAETGVYTVQTTVNSIGDQEYERVLLTAKTYALRMIEMASTKDLGTYFDRNSQSYKTIISIDPWMQEWFFRSYEWGQESITGYYRHSENLFSVHVDLSMFVTRTDDTVKEYKVDHSFFFEKQGGAWKCINMINVDIQEQTSVVRLTYKLDDSVIFSNMYAEDAKKVDLPTVTAPEGKVFAGWFRLVTNTDGSKEYKQVFSPEADGIVELPEGTRLEPMTLYAIFENADENGGNE